MFLDDLTQSLTEVLTERSNHIVIGDFNRHIEDPTDNDAMVLNDTVLTLAVLTDWETY